MRPLLALAGWALLLVFVAFLMAMAAGANAAPVAIDERPSAQDCIELQIRHEAYGLKVGELVRTVDQAGKIISFACVGAAPGAWLIVDPRGGIGSVRLADLVRP